MFKRRFSSSESSPFDRLSWGKRRVAIVADDGSLVFEQDGIRAPVTWSDTAVTVVASKYFYGQSDSGEREYSVKQLIERVVNTIFCWADAQAYLSDESQLTLFRDELTVILLEQRASFNSPVWFNVGIQEAPQCSACFILAVEDTMESLLGLQQLEGLLFKWGSGAGTNLSPIRSSQESLLGGGVPSGPVSFMRAYDAWANVIKSGGKTRRAAKMQILNVDHPDIETFISCKGEEEKKAWALIEHGYDGTFGAAGGAYDSVAFQNANLSVRVSDSFMNAVLDDKPFTTKRIVDGKDATTYQARYLLKRMAEYAHLCGDPGIQFDDTINRWHTCPAHGRINASNPCSEYMHLDNSACNLASINLLPYLSDDNTFELSAFAHTVDVLLTAQDVLINNASYPSPEIRECATTFRQLGLGFTNLGALLMSLGLPYDSDESRSWAANITSAMTARAYLQSAKLSKALRPFAGFDENKDAMLSVLGMHREAHRELSVPETAKEEHATISSWWEEAIRLGEQSGLRNSQVSVLAPTGTISFMMDCDTTGIEPELALIKDKRLAGGGTLSLINYSVERALATLGYSSAQQEQIVAHLSATRSIAGAPQLKAEHMSVFDCALPTQGSERVISHYGHLRMMAACQPFLSGAISKTVNVPNECSVDDIYQLFIDAWQMGLKAVAVYRDGSKRTQPLSTHQGQNTERENQVTCASCGNTLPAYRGSCFICPHCGTQGACG